MAQKPSPAHLAAALAASLGAAGETTTPAQAETVDPTKVEQIDPSALTQSLADAMPSEAQGSYSKEAFEADLADYMQKYEQADMFPSDMDERQQILMKHVISEDMHTLYDEGKLTNFQITAEAFKYTFEKYSAQHIKQVQERDEIMRTDPTMLLQSMGDKSR